MCGCKWKFGVGSVNGVGKYSWNGKDESTHPPAPPTRAPDDVLLHDEPGRCTIGMDSHSYHFQMVKNHGAFVLLVKHGGGEQRIPMRCFWNLQSVIAQMDSDSRYTLMLEMYHMQRDAADKARDTCAASWTSAFLDGRIKKVRGKQAVTIAPKVEIPQ